MVEDAVDVKKENAGVGDANSLTGDVEDRRFKEFDRGKERRVEAMQRRIEEGNKRKEKEWARMTWMEEEEEGEGSVDPDAVDTGESMRGAKRRAEMVP